MIPIVYEKERDSKHQCLKCEMEMKEGELVMIATHSSGRYSDRRLMHFDCFARHNAETMAKVLNKEYKRKLFTDKL